MPIKILLEFDEVLRKNKKNNNYPYSLCYCAFKRKTYRCSQLFISQKGQFFLHYKKEDA